eukprot:Sdes_comp16042_c0_seq2m5248
MNTLVDFTLTITFSQLIGLDMQLVSAHILPATALITLIGNAYYFWEARQLMRKEQRDDVCALPFGIATPSLIAFFNLIMFPVVQDTMNPNTGLSVALLHTFITGLVTLIGLFYGSYLRNNFPKAAMLSGLAGIGITLISMGFVFKIFDKPLLAFLPLFFFMYMLLSNTQLPYRIPMGVVLVLGGTAIGWFLRGIGRSDFDPAGYALHLQGSYPKFWYHFLMQFKEAAAYLTVSIPLALINLVGSLQNLTSAEGAGDRFSTNPTIIVNGGLMTLSAFIGNPFPTTLYIGHPMYKRLGARAAYSLLNGLVIFILCSFGGVTLILKVMPQEALYPVLMIIGIGIAAESFDTVPRRHYLAVAFGLIPAFASWAQGLVVDSINACSSYLSMVHSNVTFLNENVISAQLYMNQIPLAGMISLGQGFLLTSLCMTAALCFFIDRQHLKAAASLLLLAFMSFVGIIHSYKFTPEGVVTGLYIGQNGKYYGAAWEYAIMYLILSVVFLILYFFLGDADKSYVENIDRQLERESYDKLSHDQLILAADHSSDALSKSKNLDSV